MASNLTKKQKAALQSLVQLGLSGREEFNFVWYSDELSDISDFDDNSPQISRGDLRALEREGLIICDFQSNDKAYVVLTDKSYKAAEATKIEERHQKASEFLKLLYQKTVGENDWTKFIRLSDLTIELGFFPRKKTDEMSDVEKDGLYKLGQETETIILDLKGKKLIQLYGHPNPYYDTGEVGMTDDGIRKVEDTIAGSTIIDSTEFKLKEQLMSEYYHLKNIRDLLMEGFSEKELRELCFYEPDFKPLHKQLSQGAGQDIVVQEILDFALKQLKVEQLLEWAKSHNPTRYEKHRPYLQPPEAPNKVAQNFFLSLEDNHLGYGITLGGEYQGIPLKVAAIDWARYSTDGEVRSGWLYVPQLTASHSVAFFKVHKRDDGTGYIHLVDVASPAHPIWIETQAGDRYENYFHYDNSAGDIAFFVWNFKWKKAD